MGVQLDSKNLSAVYLIASDEVLLRQEARDSIRNRAEQLGFHQREIYCVESGFSWQEFFFKAQNYSLFDEKTLLEVNHPKASFDEKATEALIHYVNNPCQEKIVCILTEKLTPAQQKTRWYKAIEAAGQCQNIRNISFNELPQWLSARAQKLKLTLHPEAILLLAQLTQGNLFASHQALIKLQLLYPNTPISPTLLASVINDNARHNVFELGNYLLNGQTAKALHCLSGLKETGTEATLVLWAITRELRGLAELLFQQQQGISERQLLEKQWQQRRPLLKKALGRLNLEAVNELLLLAESIDQSIKGIHSLNTWEGLEQISVKLSQGADLL